MARMNWEEADAIKASKRAAVTMGFWMVWLALMAEGRFFWALVPLVLALIVIALRKEHS